MKKLFILILISALFAVKPVIAQSTEQWHFIFDGAGEGTEELFGMTVDDFGNTILIARSDTDFLDYASVIMKINPQGNLVWMVSENLNGTAAEPAAVLTDAAGNIYVTGSYDSPGNLSSDIYLVKLDSAGNQIWATYYSSAGNIIDAAKAMTWDNSGNLVVIGETGASVSTTDALVVKYDTAGNQLWFSVYSNPVNQQDQVAAVAVDADDNIYVCGSVYVDTASFRDFQVFKVNSSGTVEWARHYNGLQNKEDRCKAIIVDGAGNIIVTGESYGWGPGYPVLKIATIKYDAAGNEQWTTRFETASSTAIPQDIVVDDNNNVYVTGEAYDNTSKFDCITIKYDANGNEQWVKLIQGTLVDADGGYAMLYDDGKIYVAGAVENTSTFYDAMIAAYDESGNLLHREDWNSQSNEEEYFYRLANDGDGNLIAAGILEKLNDDDLLVVKFAPITVSVNEPEASALVIYPNPTSGEAHVQGSMLETGDELRIFDILGKEVFFTQLSHPISNFKFQTSHFENGLYFVQVKSGKSIVIRKLIVQK